MPMPRPIASASEDTLSEASIIVQTLRVPSKRSEHASANPSVNIWNP